MVNQEKITGQCRKLLCCLAYEKEVYEMLRASLPAVGSTVLTPEGQGEVVELRILQQAVKARLADSHAYKVFPLEHLGEKAQAAREAAEAAAAAEVAAAQYRPEQRREGSGRKRGAGESGPGGEKKGGDEADGRRPRRDRRRRPKKKTDHRTGDAPPRSDAQGAGGQGKAKPRREGGQPGGEGAGRGRRRRRKRPENK